MNKPTKFLNVLISLALLWLILPVNNAKAAVLESLQVSSLNSIPVISNSILENGTMYMVETNGVYTFSSGGRIADAEYAYDPDTNSFYEELNVVNKVYNLDLLVNGVPQDWLGSSNGTDYYPHTFSPNHSYRLYILGQGQPLSFFIYDSSYDWNDGYLTVSISSNLPSNKNDCKNKGWKLYSDMYKNQGFCIKETN